MSGGGVAAGLAGLMVDASGRLAVGVCDSLLQLDRPAMKSAPAPTATIVDLSEVGTSFLPVAKWVVRAMGRLGGVLVFGRRRGDQASLEVSAMRPPVGMDPGSTRAIHPPRSRTRSMISSTQSSVTSGSSTSWAGSRWSPSALTRAG